MLYDSHNRHSLSRPCVLEPNWFLYYSGRRQHQGQWSRSGSSSRQGLPRNVNQRHYLDHRYCCYRSRSGTWRCFVFELQLQLQLQFQLKLGSDFLQLLPDQRHVLHYSTLRLRLMLVLLLLLILQLLLLVREHLLQLLLLHIGHRKHCVSRACSTYQSDVVFDDMALCYIDSRQCIQCATLHW